MSNTQQGSRSNNSSWFAVCSISFCGVLLISSSADEEGLECSGTIDLLIQFLFSYLNFSFATRVSNYNLSMFSEIYDCIVEFQ